VSFKVVLRPQAGPSFEVLDVEEVRDGIDHDTATAFKVGNPTDWYQVILAGPHKTKIHWPLRSGRTLTFLACGKDGHFAGVGSRAVTVTSASTAKLLSVLIVLLLYAGFTTIVWADRKRMSQAKEVPPPLRWHPIKPFRWVRCADPVVRPPARLRESSGRREPEGG
jgi:hypothetical protein